MALVLVNQWVMEHLSTSALRRTKVWVKYVAG